MQPMTPAQVAAITSTYLEVRVGLDLLDDEDNFVEDLTLDMGSGGTVSRKNYATVHGTINGLRIHRELHWGEVRVRPYATVNGERFNLGVYVLTTPTYDLGKGQGFTVDGYDKLSVLQRPIGDSYWVPLGTSYVQAVRDVLVASGAPPRTILIDGESESTVLESDMVWALDGENPTSWLRVANDLLGAVGYRGLWVDPEGVFRSERYRTAGERPVEWTFDVTNPETSIVYQDRVLELDEYEPYNWWRFVRKDHQITPSEGNGMYTVDFSGSDRRVKRFQVIEAADQQSLITQGSRIVESDRLRTRLVKIQTGPLPSLGHFDIFDYLDPEVGDGLAMARSWDFSLVDGATTIELEVFQ